jgi:hypothetical protein
MKSIIFRAGAALAVLFGFVLVILGCGDEEPVCLGEPEHVVFLPSTSYSDLKVSQELAPEVGRQLVARAAASCGRLSVAILNNQPESDLELQSVKLVPERTTAFNRKPIIKELVTAGERFLQDKLLDPLAETPVTHGSPFHGGLVKIGAELEAHEGGPATVVVLGDGIAVERSPETSGVINFSNRVVPEERLDEFVPRLTSLKGSCVMFIAAGAESNLPDERLRDARAMMENTLSKAGVEFVATRSRQVPRSCEESGQ